MPKIEQLYAWVAVDAPTETDDNNEGVMAIQIGDAWMPLVGADKARIDSLGADAKAGAKAAGVALRLVSFSVREDLESYPVEEGS